MRLKPQLNHELVMAKNATSATALRGVVGHAAIARMTRPTGREVASTCPVMMMSAICSVNGINSQKPFPQASITCGTARRREGDAGDNHDQRRDEREDEGIGHPALGPVGQRERHAREESRLLRRVRVFLRNA